MPTLEQKIGIWQKSLLDLSRRNRLIHCVESRRGFLAITRPDALSLYRQLVREEKKLTFVRPVTRDADARVFSMLQLMKAAGEPLQVTLGEMHTSQPFPEQAQTLRLIRNKARLAFDEQGQNLLYLAVGFVRWHDHGSLMNSPLLLVPVSLENSAPSAPFQLQLRDDEIVLNPTLAHLFSERFRFTFPPFDPEQDEPEDYFHLLRERFAPQGWTLMEECRLGIFSFQKINMYRDLAANAPKVLENPVLRSMYGSVKAPVPPPADHDAVAPAEVCRIISADSSQLDAIECSRKGLSFVLQGPPGTGKSQTITNIIAQALADGKRVLFVSEKMAALQVVYSRLVKAGLGDFCLPLHDPKANKREILQMLGDSLDKQRSPGMTDAAAEAKKLETLRGRLMRYPEQLHRQRLPLGLSLYEAFGRLISLLDAPTVLLPVADPSGISSDSLAREEELLQHAARVESSLSVPPGQNPWRGLRAELFSQEQRHHAILAMIGALAKHRALTDSLDRAREAFRWPIGDTHEAVVRALQLARAILALPAIPPAWLVENISSVARKLRFFADEQEAQQDRLARLKDMLTVLPAPGEVLSAYADTADLRRQLTQAGINLDGLAETIRQLQRAQLDFGQWLDAWRPAAQDWWRPTAPMADALSLWTAAKALCDLPAFSAGWLDQHARSAAIAAIGRLAGAEASLRQAQAALYGEFKEDVLELSPEALAGEAASLSDRDPDVPLPPLVGQLFALRRSVAIPEAFTAEPAVNAPAWLREMDRLWPADGDAQPQGSLNHLDEALGQLAGLQKMLAQLRTAGAGLPQGIPRDTLEDYRVIQHAFDAITRAGLFPVRWLASRHREEARRALAEFLPLYSDCTALEAALLRNYDAGILRVEPEGMLRRFRSEYTSVFKHFRSSYREDVRLLVSLKKTPGRLTDQQAMQLLSDLVSLRETQAKYESLLASRRDLFTDAEATALPPWDVVAARLDALSEAGIADVLERIAGDEALCRLQRLSSLHQALAESPVDRICALLAQWLPGRSMLSAVLLPQLEALVAGQVDRLSHVRQLLASTAAVRRPHVDHQTVYASMKAIAEGQRACLENAAASLKAYRQAMAAYDALAPDAAGFLQGLWQGHDTDWARAEQTLRSLDAPQAQTLYAKLYDTARRESGEGWMARLRTLAGHSPEAVLAAVAPCCPSAREQSAVSVQESLHALQEAAAAMAAVLERASGLVRGDMSNTGKADMLALLVAWAEAERQADASAGEKRALAGDGYDGRNTRWEALLRATEQLRGLAEAWPDTDMAAEPFLSLVTGYPREGLSAWAAQAEERLRDYTAAYDQCRALFDQGAWGSDTLTGQRALLAAAAEQPALLDQWQQYSRCMRQLDQAGLGKAMALLHGQRIPPDQYVRAYDKAVLLAWIGAQLGDAPDVADFDAAAYGETILRYQAQDDRCLEVSRDRLQQDLTDRMPRSSASSSGELAILMHELGKRTRIMPIRKLFRQIPYLLQDLKPCLMMSPLSVSYFLDSDFYQFDMVIFDEASQIFPQDAIGAILRSKQAIIAGDTKQMPPSNFFAASLEGEDEDEDDPEEDSTPLGSSILEEASFTLPQMSLLWHYRSHDERLIAFSNQHFYHNNLCTFPGNRVAQADLGVEYIHLPDGVYQNRRNRREAEKCVMLIYQHIMRHPERSLGVVAFSEAQQAEIEDLLWQQRERLPQYNAFFDEDRPEPFFIKNLENVQGDERDTIIFSICYARSTDGRMRLNFGPLGKAGGERRLNVAVTRARYNIKLIGSILPGDIDLNRARSEGARLLRSYIEYAMAAPDAQGATASAEAQPDRFADEVAHALEMHGYTVSRNVGRSAFRVDIAVHARDGSSAYMAGILCDGAGYARARTVRDRDSIRRKMLANLGWIILDCWSAEWAAHPDNALRSLLEKLEALARGTYQEQTPAPEPAAVISEAAATPAQKPAEPAALALPEYETARLSDALEGWQPVGEPRRCSDEQRLILACVRCEQPIHMDVLYQRMAPFCGREKVTSVVKNTVQEQLAGLMGREITLEEGFLTMKGSAAVTARRAGGRDIEQISYPELMEAMKLLLQSAYGLSTEEVIQECARLLGYARTGQRIESRLRETLRRMVRAGWVTLVKDKVQWRGDAT